MKKSLLIVALLFTALSLKSQEILSPTTMTEYNYVTKGYKIQLESGLDMKKGYTFKRFTGRMPVALKGITRYTEFMHLFKEGVKSPVAILVMISNSSSPNVFYFCIPNLYSSQELWNQASSDWFKAANAAKWDTSSSIHLWNTFKALSTLSVNSVLKK